MHSTQSLQSAVSAMVRVLDPVNIISDRFVGYKIGEVLVNGKGAKSARVESYGQPTIFNLGDREQPVISPFGAKSLGDEVNPRLTIEFKLNENPEAHWNAFRKSAIAYLAEHSERLFKKKLTLEQVQDGYHPTVKRHVAEAYEPLLRCKIDTTGRREVSYWTPEGVRREAPTDWRRVRVIPQLEIPNLWSMSREMGWVIQCTALRIFEESVECPFAAIGAESESMEE